MIYTSNKRKKSSEREKSLEDEKHIGLLSPFVIQKLFVFFNSGNDYTLPTFLLSLTMYKETKTQEHERLANVIKSVHKKLRREFRANKETYEVVWQQHVQNSEILRHYSEAMYHLATEHWTVYPETRIDWCRKVALEYFMQNGMQVALEKDAKRRLHEIQRAVKMSHSTTPDEVTNETTVLPVKADSDNSHVVCVKKCRGNNPELNTSLKETFNHVLTTNDENVLPITEIVLPLCGKIRLLDVGSCYNPFRNFSEFEALGIDLSPAIETVLQCDFLSLTVTPSDCDLLTSDLHSLASPLQQLPGRSFHVVVFSLLLEYLPSPDQRWLCCLQAHSLLAMHGLLLIVTPDSHSQHRNSPMMKSWKQALESLGFCRWKYEKKDHIHCMAFRKLAEADNSDPTRCLNQGEARNVAEMLYIPQDFNATCYDNVNETVHVIPEDAQDTEDFVVATANELPLFDFEDG